MKPFPKTPLPWTNDFVSPQSRFFRVEGTKEVVAARIANRENAAYIAHACNAYPKLESDRARLIEALRWILPLAEGYLKSAPTHPDNAKLESARALLREIGGTQ